MSNIKAGEYVRTTHGEIAIFRGWNNNPKSQWSCKLEFQKNKTWKYCCEEYIKSHSPDIIGLVEVGDYVNGYLINYIPNNEKAVYQDASDCEDVEKFENKDIKTIVTHEQFEEMEYKL